MTELRLGLRENLPQFTLLVFLKDIPPAGREDVAIWTA